MKKSREARLPFSQRKIHVVQNHMLNPILKKYLNLGLWGQKKKKKFWAIWDQNAFLNKPIVQTPISSFHIKILLFLLLIALI